MRREPAGGPGARWVSIEEVPTAVLDDLMDLARDHGMAFRWTPRAHDRAGAECCFVLSASELRAALAWDCTLSLGDAVIGTGYLGDLRGVTIMALRDGLQKLSELEYALRRDSGPRGKQSRVTEDRAKRVERGDRTRAALAAGREVLERLPNAWPTVVGQAEAGGS